jgi:cytochrome c biogenesis protein CcdA
VWTGKGRVTRDCPVAQQRCCTMTPEQAEKRGMAWVVGAFLICPCHLPLTLAAMAAVLSGTAAATVLHQHPYAAGAVVTVTWLAGTLRGVWYFRASQR